MTRPHVAEAVPSGISSPPPASDWSSMSQSGEHLVDEVVGAGQEHLASDEQDAVTRGST